MWLIRFGLVDQNIFFGFCAVVFCILVLVVASILVRACAIKFYTPGHSLSFFINFASLLICLTILFRGVQPAWGSQYMLVNVCQIFVPPMVLGYTMLAAALLAKSFILLMHFRWQKNTEEYLPNFLLWILLVIAGAAVIVWEVTFMPNVQQQSMTSGNKTMEVYMCEGWSSNTDNQAQFAWKVALSCYFAFILLLAVISLPFYTGIQNLSARQAPAVHCVLIIIVNSLLCVIAGLIVWFQYHPTPERQDSMLYAIIGSLQLWMLVVANAALLASEVRVSGMRGKANLRRSSSDDQLRSKIKIKSIGASRLAKSPRPRDNYDTVDTTFQNPMAADDNNGYLESNNKTEYAETLPDYHGDNTVAETNQVPDYLQPTLSVYSSVGNELPIPLIELKGESEEEPEGESNHGYDDEHPSY